METFVTMEFVTLQFVKLLATANLVKFVYKEFVCPSHKVGIQYDGNFT